MEFGHKWQKTIIRIVSHPTVEAIAVLALTVLAIYIVVDTDPLTRSPHLPVLFGAH